MLDHLEKSYFNRVAKDKYSFVKAKRFPKISKNQTIDIEEHHRGNSELYRELYERRNWSIQTEERNISFGFRRNMNKHKSQGQCEKIMKETYVPKWQVTKPKHPSCVIVDKHQNLNSFLQLAEKQKSPDPFKYYPRDRIYSRHKCQVGIKFGTARRFNYDIQPQAKKLGPGYYYRKPQESKIKNGAFNHTKRTTYVDVEIDHSISPGPKYYIY